MAIRTKLIIVAAYVYLILPFLIFAGGYLKIGYAIPVVLIVGFSMIKAIREENLSDLPSLNKKDILKFALVGIVVLVWIILSGIGDLFYQNTDHQCRDAIFNVMVNLKWPVEHGVFAGRDASVRALVYYNGFWFPSALVGKLLSLEAGYIFQIVWAWAGLMLMYCLLCMYRKKIQVWPLIIVIFFSGLDIIRQNIYMDSPLFSTAYLDFAIKNFNYPSNIGHMAGAYNTTIPCFVATMLVINQPRRSNIILAWSTLILSATFPFVGIIPYVLYVIFKKEEGKSLTDKIRETCSLQNIAGGGLIGIISFLYAISNTASGYHGPDDYQAGFILPVMLSASVQSFPMLLSQAAGALADIWNKVIWNKLGAYVIFIFFEVGIYFALLFKKYKKSAVFWITVGTLLVCPWIEVGVACDFCLKASMPALLILTLLIIDQLGEWGKRKVLNVALVVCLCVGSVTGLHQMAGYIELECQGIEQLTCTTQQILEGLNFSGNTDNFFFKYLAKKREPAVLSELTVIEAVNPRDMYLVEDYSLAGIEFSVELNALATKKFHIQFDTAVERDVYFEDVGILMDYSVNYQLIVNGHEVGVMDYNCTSCYIPKEYFNEEAQCITIIPNKEIKMYIGDYIYFKF